MPVISVPIELYHKKFLTKLFVIDALPLDDDRFKFLHCVVSKPRAGKPVQKEMHFKAPSHINIIIPDAMVMRMKYFSYFQNKKEFNARVDNLFRQYFMLHMSEVLMYTTPEAENKLFEFIEKFDLKATDGITYSALYKYYQRHRAGFNIEKQQNWAWKTFENKKI